MTNVAGHSQLLPHCLSTVQMVTGNKSQQESELSILLGLTSCQIIV